MTDKIEQPKPKTVHTFLCEKCGYEAKTQDDYRTHKVDHQLGREFVRNENTGTVEKIEVKPPVVISPEVIKQVIQDTPIKLYYIYRGTCPTCGNDVETIPVDDVDKTKTVCVAWCLNCRKKIQQRTVNKL